MKPYVIIVLFHLCCFSVLQAEGGAPPAGPSWIRDFNEGQRRASEEKKDLLVVFTGHGWCANCEILDREVFRKPEFVRETANSFVFVELDFTFGDSRQERQREQTYRDLQKRYLAPAVPMVFLMDQQGTPYAILEGYKEGAGLQKTLALIEQGRAARAQRDRKFATARKATGQEHAKLLHDGLQAVALLLGSLEDLGDDPILAFYPTVVADIRQLDSGGAARLRAVYDSRQKKRDETIALDQSTFDRLKAFQKAKDYKGGIAFVEAALKEFKTPDIRWRLEGSREFFLEWDDQYEAGLKNVQRLLGDANLAPEQRERWLDREAFHLSHLGRVAEALAIYDRQIRDAQGAPEKRLRWLSRKAQLVFARGAGIAPRERVNALKEYREAAQPGTEAWQTATFLLAHQFQRDGDHREALKFKRELLQAEPKDPWLMVDVAESHAALHDNQAARALIRDAERVLPGSFERQSEKDQDKRIRARIARLRDQLAKHTAQ